MKRLKAFTLIELIVALIISGIVISIAATCYQIVYKQYKEYKNVNETLSQAALLNMLLNKDFQNFQYVNKTSDGIEFSGFSTQQTSNEEQKTVYEFGQQYIIRKYTTIQDTFGVVLANTSLKFQNKEIENNSTLVDELSFETDVIQENETFHYKKQYGADVLMKLENKE